MNTRYCRTSAVLLAACLSALAGSPAKGPSPKVVQLDAAGKDYLQLLSGPPETATMRSGLVTLAPGKSVGRHSTHGNEEVLVILEGSGEFRLGSGEVLPVKEGSILYCPPQREHDVLNTGKGTLRYVYIVAKAGN